MDGGDPYGGAGVGVAGPGIRWSGPYGADPFYRSYPGPLTGRSYGYGVDPFGRGFDPFVLSSENDTVSSRTIGSIYARRQRS